jgi:monoamine oxidase
MEKPRITIIGAGLSGLTIACLLQDSGFPATTLEARNRLGGRIYTHRQEGMAPIELGATWFGNQHKYLIDLMQELGVERERQHIGDDLYYEMNSMSPPQLVHLPSGNDETYRLKKGTDSLIHALAGRLDGESRIRTGVVVKRITKVPEKIKLTTSKGDVETDILISTIPPKLFSDTVTVEPALPSSFMKTASLTQTWMADSIKIGFRYKRPFWRGAGLSGTIMSNVGPLTEMYDHSSFGDDVAYALKGFMAGSYYSVSAGRRREAALLQLKKFYGEQSLNPLSIVEKVWRNDPLTFSEYSDNVIPHQNNGHDLFQKPYLEGSLWFAGAETSAISPGYMDGAVNSAKQVVKKIVAQIH